MDKSKLTAIFNRGFRLGANERANSGLALSREIRSPSEVPDFPEAGYTLCEQKAWSEGYMMGYQVGASDADLASVEVPGAHGMISGMSEQMLEMFGVFNKILDEN